MADKFVARGVRIRNDARQRYYRNFITPGFFSTLGITVTRGREFTDPDLADTPPVAIINESAAKRLWGTDDAVGRRFRMGDAAGPAAEIVGVVPDARFRSLTTDLPALRVEPDVYFPYAQRSDSDIQIAVRTTDGSALPLAALQHDDQ